MVDAPERIFASGLVFAAAYQVRNLDGLTEYVRADRIEALERQLTEARADVRRLTEEQVRIVEINKQHCKTINSYIVDNSRQEDARKAAEAERDRLAASLTAIAEYSYTFGRHVQRLKAMARTALAGKE